MQKKIVLLPGDGIGPAVTEAAASVLQQVADIFSHTFTFQEKQIGGAAIDTFGEPLPADTLQACKEADAILLGAVGGPEWDRQPPHLRPEKGLLQLRKGLGLFANLRPVKTFPSLLSSSPLKQEIVAGSDLLIVRELTGGLYFGTPSERRDEGQTVVDTLHYERNEIERIVETGFQSAMLRNKRLASVDKANVLESSKLWREIVDEKRKDYPEVAVEHMLVDSTAMKLITNPTYFDVIVTENLFGDILSDEASVLTGSLGLLPSASLRADALGLYEPVHGSAPDIAGKDIANPLGAILSAVMLLRYSFGMEKEADAVEAAVNEVLQSGFGTQDMQVKPESIVGTEKMTSLVIEQLMTAKVSS
ncbi:3-isopropylmalate dehydrogenase [Terribacillus halophilus]|uniref:3-isopropylmalate dehydrogenase n=1 Tax=Terribacillus halophilus TaxID=361279 RepID=A0A1G6NQI1_9BACI|nr:3-isopropylmalate dehydrogenase [Terribacillus halophilus]SDC69931.1 3-isopropylmalate dehydrogenase [Terribacillus halophilus]